MAISCKGQIAARMAAAESATTAAVIAAVAAALLLLGLTRGARMCVCVCNTHRVNPLMKREWRIESEIDYDELKDREAGEERMTNIIINILVLNNKLFHTERRETEERREAKNYYGF